MITNTSIDTALHALAEGHMILVADDEERENEGDLVMAAQHVDTESMVFLLRHGSGLVCTPMTSAIADDLELEPMVRVNTDNHGTAFTITVDAVESGTGISAHDRAMTVRALTSPTTTPTDLRRPGHIFPLRARCGGVLERSGHTEASVDLMKLAGLQEIAVITELVGDDGVPLSGDQLTEFARTHDIPMITIAELVQYRQRTDKVVHLSGPAYLPTDTGPFHARSYLSTADGIEHFVLTHGDIADAGAAPAGVLTRIHSECLTGDLFRSRRCDCGSQLDAALQAIIDEGAGILIYLRGQEGRGIGLGAKLCAYKLQENGCDTVDANIRLGLPVDGRDYSMASAILHDLGAHRIRPITNNPHKVSTLESSGITVVQRVELPPAVTPDNLRYLTTKRDRMGHLLDLPHALHS